MNEHGYTSLEERRWPKTISMIVGLMAVAGLVTIGAYGSRSSSNPQFIQIPELERFAITQEEYDDIKTVFSIIVEDEESYQVTCSIESDFAFCADAECSEIDHMSGLCGCKTESGSKGTFAIDSASMTLIRSPIYRAAAQLIYKGNTTTGEAMLCKALNEGTLFKSAGFDTEIGSFYLTGDSELEGVTSTSTSVEKTGSCMGSPCTMKSWCGGCAATCLCWNYVKDSTSDSFVEGTASTDSCYSNTAATQSELPWNKNMKSLFTYIDELVDRFDQIGNYLGDDLCSGDCTVA